LTELLRGQALLEKLENRKLTDSEVVQLLKAKHLQTAQKGTGQSATDVSNYVEWNFAASKSIYTKLHSDKVIADIVYKHEVLKGSDSPFNSLVKLEKLAQRPSCVTSRRFIFQMMDDLLCHGVIQDDDLGKKQLIGSSASPGVINLYEFKWRCLSFILDIMFVQGKLRDADRLVLKDRLCDPVQARLHTMENLSWQAGLCKSSLEALEFVYDVVYLKQFDNVIRQAMKPNSHPEILLESEPVLEAWKRVTNARENELAEEKALLEKEAGSKSDDEEEQDGSHADLLKQARKTPNTLPQGSPQYWRAIANQTVRMYCTFLTENNTAANVVSTLEKLDLPVGEVGKSAILVHLDTSLLGESTGPSCQEALRKNWRPDEALLQKLLGSALVALGAQQDKTGKCTAPGEGVVAAVVDPLNVVPKGFLKDSASQTVWLCFNED
jgi:hypothetical protein